MRGNIRVRMAEKPQLVGDLDAAEDKLPALNELVDVIAVSDSQRHEASPTIRMEPA